MVIESATNVKRSGSKIIVHQNDLVMKAGAWGGSPIVIHKFKLLFFTVPMNSCQEFKRLFRRMEGYEDWAIEWNSPPRLYFPDKPMSKLPHDPSVNSLTYLN
jgi:hypothetical protein